MIKSMTAYGRSEYQQGESLLVAEIRSFNNRHRDIILRIPGNFQVLERELRSIISSRVKRGRIEISIQRRNGCGDTPYALELNAPLVESYFKIFDQLAEQFGIDKDIRLESLCQMKDVVLVKQEDVDIDEARPGFHEVLKLALDSYDEMRLKEGDAIKEDFLKRLDLLDRYINEVDKRAPDVVEDYRMRLNEKINRILNEVEVDEGRLAQEVAFFAGRSDITEEVVRVKSHLKQFREYLSLEDALGKRLDFLIQEINREVNTLGSKASDITISKLAVEMKAELEKLREQIQNVE